MADGLSVYAFTCGHLTGDLGHLMEGGEGGSGCRSRPI